MICARSNPSSVNHESRHTMNIQDEFKVGVPVEEAWRVFLDVERIAPCMPGAQLQEVEGDEYRGIVKVKVGPITAQYKGAARIVEADEAARRIVIKAEGRDTRGKATRRRPSLQPSLPTVMAPRSTSTPISTSPARSPSSVAGHGRRQHEAPRAVRDVPPRDGARTRGAAFGSPAPDVAHPHRAAAPAPPHHIPRLQAQLQRAPARMPRRQPSGRSMRPKRRRWIS